MRIIYWSIRFIIQIKLANLTIRVLISECESHEILTYHPFYLGTIYVLRGRYSGYYFPHSGHVYPPIFVAGYPARVCIEMSSSRAQIRRKGKERRGEERKEERRDYLNTVVSGVSCDPPGGSRWSPLESAGPPQTCPSRRVTYGGHPRAELPPSSLSRLLFGHEGSVK